MRIIIAEIACIMQACYYPPVKRTSKSQCPVNYALESFGDSWSLLIVRDIIFWGNRTYRDFLHSQERIATNILADRLNDLERQDILQKSPHPTDKRRDLYTLTEKGLDLIPIILEMSAWSVRHDRLTPLAPPFVKILAADRTRTLALIRQAVQQGDSLFTGSSSVVERLGLSS